MSQHLDLEDDRIPLSRFELQLYLEEFEFHAGLHREAGRHDAAERADKTAERLRETLQKALPGDDRGF